MMLLLMLMLMLMLMLILLILLILLMIWKLLLAVLLVMMLLLLLLLLSLSLAWFHLWSTLAWWLNGTALLVHQVVLQRWLSETALSLCFWRLQLTKSTKNNYERGVYGNGSATITVGHSPTFGCLPTDSNSGKLPYQGNRGDEQSSL
jgi:hypothetical protein